MSTLSVGTIKSVSSAAPVFQNSSGTEKGQLAKAWVNYDSYNNTIHASFNISSVTDHATGDYTYNFTNSFADTDYAWSGSCSTATSTRVAPRCLGFWATNQSTSDAALAVGSTRVRIFLPSNHNLNDADYVMIHWYR